MFSFTPHPVVAAAAAQLRVSDLSVGQGDWQLCRGWSHAWVPGVHLLQGGDGAGKSSILRVLAGAAPLRAGQVQWAGQAGMPTTVFWVDPRQPVLPALFKDTPQQWSAHLALHYPRWDAAQWQAHVQHWQLHEALVKPWHALSTGTARKLWMAAGFASGAALVLVDEPIAGLDRPSVAYLREVLAARATQAAPLPQWLLVAHYDDLNGVPWRSVVELEALPQ